MTGFPVAIAGIKEEQTRFALEHIALELGRFQGRIFTGSGSPETVVTANKGAIFLRSDGGAGTSLYVKESGSGNTGWVGK